MQATQQDPPDPTSSPKAKRKSSPSWVGKGAVWAEKNMFEWKNKDIFTHKSIQVYLEMYFLYVYLYIFLEMEAETLQTCWDHLLLSL